MAVLDKNYVEKFRAAVTRLPQEAILARVMLHKDPIDTAQLRTGKQTNAKAAKASLSFRLLAQALCQALASRKIKQLHIQTRDTFQIGNNNNNNTTEEEEAEAEAELPMHWWDDWLEPAAALPCEKLILDVSLVDSQNAERAFLQGLSRNPNRGTLELIPRGLDEQWLHRLVDHYCQDASISGSINLGSCRDTIDDSLRVHWLVRILQQSRLSAVKYVRFYNKGQDLSHSLLEQLTRALMQNTTLHTLEGFCFPPNVIEAILDALDSRDDKNCNKNLKCLRLRQVQQQSLDHLLDKLPRMQSIACLEISGDGTLPRGEWKLGAVRKHATLEEFKVARAGFIFNRTIAPYLKRNKLLRQANQAVKHAIAHSHSWGCTLVYLGQRKDAQATSASAMFTLLQAQDWSRYTTTSNDNNKTLTTGNSSCRA